MMNNSEMACYIIYSSRFSKNFFMYTDYYAIYLSYCFHYKLIFTFTETSLEEELYFLAHD